MFSSAGATTYEGVKVGFSI